MQFIVSLQGAPYGFQLYFTRRRFCQEGASFHKEGPGNVDHVMWATMTKNGPQMANIALKGLYDRKGLDPEMFGAYAAREQTRNRTRRRSELRAALQEAATGLVLQSALFGPSQCTMLRHSFS